MSHILVVEDEAIIRQSVRRLLQRHNYDVTDVDSLDAAKREDLSRYDLIISDLRLPGGMGTELVELAGDTPVLIMTSYASLRSAVDAMKMGAVDYIAKPFDHEEMAQAVKRILTESRLSHKPAASAELKKEVNKEYPHSGIIGSCEPMLLLFKKISKVAPTDATVLILGESGTGKELVARAMHEQSRRAAAPIISVNCAAIPETLIESELFGHEKGAFTGANSTRQGLVEAADGGTLFLDEIGELPLEAQARLLRVLQEGEIRRVGSVQSKKVDVRLVAATHRNLKEMASRGEFREDLYYRLNVVELHLPPLRDRGEDVVEIAGAMLTRACNKMQLQPMHFTSDAIQAIRQYQWPGNVRELENAVERAVILADDNEIPASILGIDLSPDRYISQSMRENLVQTEQYAPVVGQQQQGDLSLDDYFVHFVLENEHNMTETDLARKLGISRKSLWERRQRLGIPRRKGTR
ncbi:sigma-54-dependent transcriptional regulator [Thalassolituus sp. LLYu03]|uniref:sigma-54-dependent transcriptional regulator n=1 Tax=Thalassolituus sp. LLYu03 TaxID=3421656 RepID=UPI003D2B5689